RYGAPDCTADTCEYFLSYRRLSDDVEFELSAETDGWVAIGFSSDRKMGGDDVMACVYHAGNVRVQHYQTVGQWVRELRQNPARDEEGMFADGRLTCRFRRPLSSRRQEDMVDLHLGWYFLFAWGPASHGMVTRHDIDSPPMTDFLVSIFRYVDVHIPSPNYQSDASPGCLLLIVAFAFYTLMGRP
uniref:Ferric-chelate reductase 1-like n=1 Tax=Eptatretus burgeri TaxID=7764 RepID=A0A8C4NPN4_EPTBU